MQLLLGLGLLAIIIGAGVVIYNDLNPSAPPPPTPTPTPAAPPSPPPPPPPPPPVSAASHPERFTVIFVTAPATIKGTGRFVAQVIPFGYWAPGEVPMAGTATLELDLLDGDGKGIVSAMKELRMNPQTGQMELVQASFLNQVAHADGSVPIDIMFTAERAGVDIVRVTLPGSPLPPALARYSITP